MVRPRVVVLGTPCGGTKYMYGWLRQWGLRVGHERTGEEGRVCGFWSLLGAGPSDRVRSKNRAAPLTYDPWTHLGVVVRQPLRVAETLPLFARQGLGFDVGLEFDGGDRDILSALRYWVASHQAARQHLERFPGETFVVRLGSQRESDLAVLRTKLGFDDVEPTRDPRPSVSRPGQRWERKDWDWWLGRDPVWAGRALELLKAYGMSREEEL